MEYVIGSSLVQKGKTFGKGCERSGNSRYDLTNHMKMNLDNSR